MLVIPPEAGRAVAAFGSVAVFQLEGNQTAGHFCLVFAETPPGVGPPPHVHHGDDELFLVLQGELSFLTPRGWVMTTPGTAVYIPRGVVHAFQKHRDHAEPALGAHLSQWLRAVLHQGG
jgi:mannose-6-phosphate isomerase-like protein (cupin superfamily)